MTARGYSSPEAIAARSCDFETDAGYCGAPAVKWDAEPGPGGTYLCADHGRCFDPCPSCDGRGEVCADPDCTDPECDGVRHESGLMTCHRCNGDGFDGCRGGGQ